MEIETIIGVKLTHIVAGIAGGTVRALLMGSGWLAATTSVIIGSATAAYLTTPAYYMATRYFPVPQEPSTEHAIGFLVGLTAMLICEGCMKYVKDWSIKPSLPGPKP
jgi:hypothetical protein